MVTRLPLRVWIVEPHDELRTMLREVAPAEAEVLDEADFSRRIAGGSRPDALLIDGSTLLRLDGERPALDGMLRTLVVTGRPADDLPAPYLDRPSVRLLRKPFEIDEVERGLAWLTGSDDDAWAEPVSR
jgi:hypothetical protein